MQISKVVQQQPVNDAIASTDTLKEHPSCRIIENACSIPWKQTRSRQIEAQDVVTKNSLEAATQSQKDDTKQSKRQSIDRSDGEPRYDARKDARQRCGHESKLCRASNPFVWSAMVMLGKLLV